VLYGTVIAIVTAAESLWMRALGITKFIQGLSDYRVVWVAILLICVAFTAVSATLGGKMIKDDWSESKGWVYVLSSIFLPIKAGDNFTKLVKAPMGRCERNRRFGHRALGDR
jgi:hypothetical protein